LWQRVSSRREFPRPRYDDRRSWCKRSPSPWPLPLRGNEGIEQSRADLGVRAFAEPAPTRTLALVWRSRSFLGEGLRRVAEVMRTAYPESARRPPSPRGSPRPRRGRGSGWGGAV